jgi:hypothetical protein
MWQDAPLASTRKPALRRIPKAGVGLPQKSVGKGSGRPVRLGKIAIGSVLAILRAFHLRKEITQ